MITSETLVKWSAGTVCDQFSFMEICPEMLTICRCLRVTWRRSMVSKIHLPSQEVFANDRLSNRQRCIRQLSVYPERSPCSAHLNRTTNVKRSSTRIEEFERKKLVPSGGSRRYNVRVCPDNRHLLSGGRCAAAAPGVTAAGVRTRCRGHAPLTVQHSRSVLLRPVRVPAAVHPQGSAMARVRALFDFVDALRYKN